MNRVIDISNQKFGRLIVEQLSYINQAGHTFWLCKCDCGNKTIVGKSNLKCGGTQSCGCLHSEVAHKNNFQDLAGKRFANLTVICYSHKSEFGAIYWLCKCDCGNEKIIQGNSLRNGNTKSCGCFSRQKTWESISGEKHWNWRGGTSNEKYPDEWTDELRENIRNRDNHKCQYPDCVYDDTKENKKLDVHHIDGNKNNCEMYNLISLCHKHHSKIEFSNPELWIDYFYNIMGDYK